MDIGATLREARERHGLTLHQVQAELKIRERYLEALEANDFVTIPGEVYARGFLRSYAKFLGLDAELMLKSMPQPDYASLDDDEDAKTSVRPPASQRMPRPARLQPAPMPIAQRRPRQWPWVVLPLVFIAAFLYYIGSSHLFSANGGGTPPHHSGGSGTVARRGHGGKKKGTHSGGGSTSKGSGRGSSGQTVALVPAPATNNAPYGGTQTNYTVAKGPIAVQITTTSRCWIYVATDGSVVQSTTVSAGTYSFSAQTGVVVKIGLPSAATLTIDSNAVPLSGSAAQAIGVTVQGG